jgi:hypothetical protein
VFSAQEVDPHKTSTTQDALEYPAIEKMCQGLKETLTAEYQEYQEQEVVSLIRKWESVFSLHDMDLGNTSMVKHKIRLTDDIPFKQKYRRIPPAMVDDVKQHLQEMHRLGVIRPSSSPYASNIVLVRKKDNSLRFCIDFRQLNSLTVKDAYAIPRIEESFDALHGSTWFSTLDLKGRTWRTR